jgi:hypothetical protein
MAKGKTGSAAAATDTPVADRGEAYEPPTSGAPAAEETTAEPIEEEATGVSIVPRGSTAVRTMSDVESLMMSDAEQPDNFEKGDVALPFMRVLQSNSPQVKPRNANYIDGATEGSFFNTATKQVYDGSQGIYAIPCWFEKQATLWTPRGAEGTGGFVSPVDMAMALEILKRCTKNEKKKDITPADLKGPPGSINADWGNKELSIAALYYLLVFQSKDDAGNFEPVAYPFTSTQMKKSRSWNAIIRNSRLPMPDGAGSYKAPMHGFVYHISTIPESNALGEWMGLKIVKDQPLLKYEGGQPVESFKGAANLFLAARDFKLAVEGGKIKAAAQEGYDDIEVGGEGGSPKGGKEDDDMPF